MDKWEYLVITVRQEEERWEATAGLGDPRGTVLAGPAGDIQQLLAPVGDLGWELVSVVPRQRDSAHGGDVLYFKRRLSPT